jgi:hypothetical protein
MIDKPKTVEGPALLWTRVVDLAPLANQCEHHLPIGLAISMMPRTLQHIVQEPHDRPGAGLSNVFMIVPAVGTK